MADAELHIIVKQAGDPEKLGALLNAAMDMQERPVRTVVPTGYRCSECWRDDGGHDAMCSMRLADFRREAVSGEASSEHPAQDSEPTQIRQGN